MSNSTFLEILNKEYFFEKEIGAGYFSKVMLGYKNTKIGPEKFAIKMSKKITFLKFKENNRSSGTYQNEGDILFSLKHANIIELHKTFEGFDCIYFVLDY